MLDHTPWIAVLGRWFVFWAVGIRLLLAGLRQIFRPEFTARQIFAFDSDDALTIIQELGVANLGAGVVGLVSVFMPGFVLPASLGGAIFYGGAGILHALHGDRTANRNIALWSDLFIAVVLAIYVFARIRAAAT
jgi:uncharacterized membrane protein HdeD (DUF308 family)